MITENPDFEVQVLLLDAVPSDAGLVEEALRKAGIAAAVRQVGHREDYVEALEARRPDLVLADHALQAVRSTEALRLARDRYPDVPFIFMSGELGEELAAEALQDGATDYVLRDHLVRLGPAVRRALDDVSRHREQSRAEESQRAAEHQLKLIVDALPSLISYVDTEGRYLFANQAYHRWFGVSSPDLRGRPVRDVLGDAAFETIRPFMERAFAGERIFKVFERLHSQEDYPGSGLGLAIARRSIERMGGTIGVESEPGRGSRFWIRLPAPQESP